MSDLLQPLPLRSWADRVAALRRSPRFRPIAAGCGAVLAVVVLLAVGAAFLRSSSPAPKLTLPKADPGSASPSPAAGTTPSGADAPTTTPVTVTVHVAGDVVHPGVYAIAAGGRVADAIQVAGGAAADADAEQLNLAARVSDGERIYVPRQGESAPPVADSGAAPSASGAKAGPAAPVDLNTATAAELEALPGVGPATSKAILAYRTAHGRFKSVTELLEVPGIGPAKLEALRPLVRV